MKCTIELNIDADNMVNLCTLWWGENMADVDGLITEDDPPATLKDTMTTAAYIIESINKFRR